MDVYSERGVVGNVLRMVLYLDVVDGQWRSKQTLKRKVE